MKVFTTVDDRCSGILFPGKILHLADRFRFPIAHYGVVSMTTHNVTVPNNLRIWRLNCPSDRPAERGLPFLDRGGWR
jgi:hypothetical protein